MIILKTDTEIEYIRRAGNLVTAVHQKIASSLTPGTKLSHLALLIDDIYRQQQAEPVFVLTDRSGRKCRMAACLSLNNQIGTPVDSEQMLQSGDVLNLDTGCRHEGWCADGAWSYAVGEVDGERENLLNGLRQTFDQLTELLVCGQSWNRISHVIGEYVKKSGFRLIPEIVGHGIGRELHEDPQLSWNLEPSDCVDSVVMRAGMVFAVECGLTTGCGLLQPLPDGGWKTYDGASCVHGELTFAMTERGIDVLAGRIV
ncbi:MAG: methionyl aminopeptidase [Planctomycetota bacterium]|nr:methionyl aminopeptidase [Planctomycetota bacterium]MDA1213218.1 methionyl aminopeptidase [Planctomycetota bacterium]